ncbi:hypothetical protein B0T16DRAFT_400396 [Cercophora newfieldiana]|uniref:Uncharacterized protein n=1 Tax=Cercophora newfieldiana TaxID=92897 RepID=A0AA39YQP8_9PEZI|nr:hypothetical protein B0T16DRAFT_400396 [Cercophora newfieldiana]
MEGPPTSSTTACWPFIFPHTTSSPTTFRPHGFKQPSPACFCRPHGSWQRTQSHGGCDACTRPLEKLTERSSTHNVTPRSIRGAHGNSGRAVAIKPLVG